MILLVPLTKDVVSFSSYLIYQQLLTQWTTRSFFHSSKGRIVQATVCCKVGAAALVHLRPVLGGCTILPFKDYIGLDGPALKLFETYLTNRTQCVSIKGVLSELSELAYGVPQGSVLGPIAFCIYTIPLGAILRHFKIQYHIYPDTQRF